MVPKRMHFCNLLLQQELTQVNFFTIVSFTCSYDPVRKIKLNKKKQCDRYFFVLLLRVHFFILDTCISRVNVGSQISA